MLSNEEVEQIKLLLRAAQVARDDAERACLAFINAGSDRLEDRWRNYLQDQDRAFERLEHRDWTAHPETKKVRDYVCFCRKPAKGVIAYLRAARNSAHHGLRSLVVSREQGQYYDLHHPMGRFSVSDGTDIHISNCISIDANGFGTVIENQTITGAEGRLHVHGKGPFRYRHVRRHLSVYDVLDERSGAIVRVPTIPFGPEDAAEYMACYSFDVLTWLTSRMCEAAEAAA